MISPLFSHLLIPFLVAMFLAINMGGSGTAPAIYFHELNSDKLWLEIVPTGLVLPIVSFIISLLVGKYIYKPIRKRGYPISKKINEKNLLLSLQ